MSGNWCKPTTEDYVIRETARQLALKRHRERELEREAIEASQDDSYTRRILADALASLGIEPSANAVEHLEVLVDALRIYASREGARGDDWKAAGKRGMVFQIFGKARRLWARFMQKTPELDDDDLYDIINYAVFAIRLGNDLNGSWPWDLVNS